jgi:hypothetical protein
MFLNQDFKVKKSDYPGPTDYNICPSKKIKGVLKFNSAKNQYSASNESEFYALINDQ